MWCFHLMLRTNSWLIPLLTNTFRIDTSKKERASLCDDWMWKHICRLWFSFFCHRLRGGEGRRNGSSITTKTPTIITTTMAVLGTRMGAGQVWTGHFKTLATTSWSSWFSCSWLDINNMQSDRLSSTAWALIAYLESHLFFWIMMVVWYK